MPTQRLLPDSDLDTIIHAAVDKVPYEQLENLLRWLAPLILVRDGNGKISHNMCLLCGRNPITGSYRTPRKHDRPACRHAEIFKFLP